MSKGLIHFSNEGVLTINENQSLGNWNIGEAEGFPPKTMRLSHVHKIFGHYHDGIIPATLEMLANLDYFYELDNPQSYLIQSL